MQYWTKVDTLPMTKPAIFFDRDGVLNVDVGYLYKIEDFQWIDGAIEAIKYFNDKDYYVFVITNQSGVARGYYKEEDINKLHNWMNQELAKYDAHIDEFFYCPHHVKGIIKDYSFDCECRKPKIGMIKKALDKYDVQLDSSLLIGDKDSDIECAENAGIKGLKFNAEKLDFYLK